MRGGAARKSAPKQRQANRQLALLREIRNVLRAQLYLSVQAAGHWSDLPPAANAAQLRAFVSHAAAGRWPE